MEWDLLFVLFIILVGRLLCQIQFNIDLTIRVMDINQLLFIGVNKYGQAGIGEKYHNKTFSVPKSFAFPTFIKQISCGSHHSALLTIDGNIYTMGSNIHGALGSNPALNYSFVPTLVQGLNDVTKIDCGPFHMCAIANGQLYSWGKGIDGQLGHGNTKNISKPTRVDGFDGSVEEVSCGSNHTLVLVGKGDGSRCGYAFGNGIYGQLGGGQNKNSYLPVKIKLQTIDSIAAGDNHSLFISKGALYACGDNSNGQLGTIFNKKFTPDPTLVSIDREKQCRVNGDKQCRVNGEKQCRVKMIQAKKYSLALTDSGDMYVWGLKNNFGPPKLVRSDEKYEVEVIDIRESNQKIYGLAAEGTLYSWGIKGGESKSSCFICVKQKVVSNGRAVLDFSSGDNYVLILGDIVKQIPYSSVPPSFLSCFEEIEHTPSIRMDHHDSLSSEQGSIESQFLQESKGIAESKFSHIQLGDSSADQFDDRTDFSKGFNKMKSSFEQMKPCLQEEPPALAERKDFNNLRSAIMKEKKESGMEMRSQIERSAKEAKVEEMGEQESDQYDMVKTPSSSILCEPANFLKQSTRKQNYQQRKASIYQSGFEQELCMSPDLSQNKNPTWKKKKYSYTYLDEKENLPVLKGRDRQKKQKKFDRILEMIEKSNHIGSKQSRTDLKLDDEDWQNQSEVVKSNRILRVELRDKELKISQLQQLLSRKEMEIEAQRQIIKALREKNSSNYASEQQ